MKDTPTLKVTLPSDREIAFTRVFDAPRQLVFDAWTKPELIKRWLGARAGWTFAVCTVDLKVGGKYRWVWRGPGGVEMGMGGTYREIIVPERVVMTEAFDQSWYPGEALTTLTLVERVGKTAATTTIRYESKAARDGVLKSPAQEGFGEGLDKLAEVLAAMQARGA